MKEEAIANASYVSIVDIMSLVAKCLTKGKDGQSERRDEHERKYDFYF